MAYSMDLRQRVVASAGSSESITSVAERFSVVHATVRNWIHRDHRGQLPPGMPGPKGSVKITTADEQLLRQTVTAQPGITAK